MKVCLCGTGLLRTIILARLWVHHHSQVCQTCLVCSVHPHSPRVVTLPSEEAISFLPLTAQLEGLGLMTALLPSLFNLFFVSTSCLRGLYNGLE